MHALDRLAARLGVESEFKDAGGKLRRPPRDVKRRLLAAMGVRVRRTADAEQALAALEDAEWTAPLVAAVVRRSMLPVTALITLPDGTGDVQWVIDEESGRTHSGTVGFGQLKLVERKRGVDRRCLVLEAALPLGYHRLTLHADTMPEPAAAPLIVVPDTCYVPPRLRRGEGAWGITLQLYMLRSERNWGIGDFTDLAGLAALAGKLGATMIGLNPLHATFLDAPDSPSPYSPASRLFLNPLYIDVEAVPELAACDEARTLIASESFQQDLAACRAAELVDYATVARLKVPTLERIFEAFERQAAGARRAAFDAFCGEHGDELERFCTWQQLRLHFKERDPALADWRRWPRAYRDSGSAEVGRFRAAHARRIRFFAWLQFIADEQLASAARAARASGLAIGLYRDLAVGADGSGAEAWSDAPLFADGASVGAPADTFNPSGQDWGLPPFDPHALRRHGFSTFIALIRANMRHAGGLRIDHAMGLQHLYWVPQGRRPEQGAYVSYPLDDLAGIIALESQRHRCIVVGEDLGTVPPGFRERMSERGVFSYRILFFEQNEAGRMTPPEAYPRLALAAVGSHDLAPLKGWWEGRDIELKHEHGLYPSDSSYREQSEQRARDRARLVETLDLNGIALPAGFSADSVYDGSLSLAVHALLARTSAALAAVQIEDLLEENELVNLPGCIEGYPSWRRRLPVSLEALESRPLVTILAALLGEIRPPLPVPSRRPRREPGGARRSRPA